MRNSLVVQQGFAFGVATCCQTQIAILGFQEDIASFGTGKIQGGIEQGHQDFIQNPDSVQLARGFQEKRQFFKIGGFSRNVDARDLAKKITGAVRACVVGMKNDVGDIADAEFKAIIPFQGLALNPLAVDEGPMLAALIDHAELPVF